MATKKQKIKDLVEDIDEIDKVLDTQGMDIINCLDSIRRLDNTITSILDMLYDLQKRVRALEEAGKDTSNIKVGKKGSESKGE